MKEEKKLRLQSAAIKMGVTIKDYDDFKGWLSNENTALFFLMMLGVFFGLFIGFLQWGAT